MIIDNGNHLLLSGNDAALRYLALIGGADKLAGPQRAEFAFADLASGERWTLSINDGRWPFWIFDPARRVPGTRLPIIWRSRAVWAGRRQDGTRCHRVRWRCFTSALWQPLLLAALNTDPREGSAGSRARSCARRSPPAGAPAAR